MRINSELNRLFPAFVRNIRAAALRMHCLATHVKLGILQINTFFKVFISKKSVGICPRVLAHASITEVSPGY
jgi:hypothetical protein